MTEVYDRTPGVIHNQMSELSLAKPERERYFHKRDFACIYTDIMMMYQKVPTNF
jgi:hypothetical protein